MTSGSSFFCFGLASLDNAAAHELEGADAEDVEEVEAAAAGAGEAACAAWTAALCSFLCTGFLSLRFSFLGRSLRCLGLASLCA